MKSGHYILINKSDTIERLSQQYAVSEASIINANGGKKIREGEWIIIPLNRGIVSFLNDDSLDFSDYTAVSSSSSSQYLWPVPASRRISSYFGKRGYSNHNGIDIPARTGSHVLSSTNGKVIYSGNGISGFGNLVIIAHGNGMSSVYGHLHKRFVKKGDKVYRGQVIAQVGNTGRSSGPHLHFEVRKKDQAVNPMAYLPVGRGRGYEIAGR